MKEAFRKFSNKTSELVGSPWAFMGAFLIIIAWGVSGPIFGFSDTWQLVINTGTTIVTFLMVFLIQNTQNRDAKAIHLKLDELIRAKAGARNSLVNLENLPDEDIKVVQKEFDQVKEVCEENTGLENAAIRDENLVEAPAKSGASALTRQ
jgi:low affinity Fe/Cu permease